MALASAVKTEQAHIQAFGVVDRMEALRAVFTVDGLGVSRGPQMRRRKVSARHGDPPEKLAVEKESDDVGGVAWRAKRQCRTSERKSTICVIAHDGGKA